MTFYRRCKTCDNLLKFEVKNKMEVKPCYCKVCRKWKTMQDTIDVGIQMEMEI